MQIFKAIRYQSKKRMIILGTMLLFVMVSLYLMFSLTFSADRVLRMVNDQKLPQTSFGLEATRPHKALDDKEASSFYESFEIDNYLEENPELGVSVRYTLKEAFDDFNLKSIDIQDQHLVLAGKPLDQLQNYEVAITKHYASVLDGDPIGQTLTLRREALNDDLMPWMVHYDYQPIEVVVATVIDYPYIDLVYNPIKAFRDIDLFKEVELPVILAPESFFKEIKYIDIQNNHKVFGIYERGNPLDVFAESIDSLIPDHASLSDEALIAAKEAITLENAWIEMDMNLYYENFSYSLEDHILSEAAKIGRQPRANMPHPDIKSFSTMAGMTRSNPMPLMLQQTISYFVVAGIVISSLYAFYIHLQNQLNANRKTLATFQLIGVSYRNILSAYLRLFAIFLLGSVIGFSGFVYIIGALNPTYLWTVKSLSWTLACSLGFILIVLGTFAYQLKRIARSSHSNLKTAGKSYVALPQLTQKNMVFILAAKRLSARIKLMLGFSFSIALSLSILLIAISSLTSISTIFNKDTLGVRFDYLVTNPTLEAYEAVETLNVDVAQVSKQSRVMFQDYSIHEPVSALDYGSVITFYDDIEPFVDVYRGKFPEHASTWHGEFPYEIVESFASKRMAQDKGLRPYSDKGRGTVESKYLFAKIKFSNYEQGYKIRGIFPSLLDRGYTSYFYRKLPREDQRIGKADVHDFVVLARDAQAAQEFESLAKTLGLTYLTNTEINHEFQILNNRLNQDTIYILWLVGIAMAIQTLINLSGVMLQLNHDKEQDDQLLARLGFSKRLLDQVHNLNGYIRILLSLICTAILVLILLPLLNKSLLTTFAITKIAKDLLIPILIGLGAVAILLVAVIVLKSRYRVKEQNYVENK